MEKRGDLMSTISSESATCQLDVHTRTHRDIRRHSEKQCLMQMQAQ